MKNSAPLPGDFGLCRISGVTGALVSAGQRLIGSGSHYTHAFIYVGDGQVIQAQPGGAEPVALADVIQGERFAYSLYDLSDVQRTAIVHAAERLIGTPYSYLDYLAIAEARILRSKRLESYVRSTGHMICSQLVDECYRRAGIELFPGRIPGDVAPGDLANLIGAR